MTFPRLAWRAALSTAVLAVFVPLAYVGERRWDEAVQLKLLLGLACLAVCVALPLVVRGGTRSSTSRWVLAASVFSVGTIVAGAYPALLIGPFPAPHLLHAVSLLGMLSLTVQQLRVARVVRDDESLLVEALLFGAITASVSWDVFARCGYRGDGWWNTSAALVIAVGAFVAAATAVLAVEHPRLRLAHLGIAIGAAGTVLTAVTSTRDPAAGNIGAVMGVVAAAMLVAFQPRGGMVRHGGTAATQAVRRMRLASLPVVALLVADTVAFAVSPRADGVQFVFIAVVIVVAAVRQAASARAIDRTHARLSFQALHDSLTGLGNRAALAEALTAPDSAQSLVILELGGLDDVTDVLGVAVGEEVLRAAGANLREHVTAHGGTTFRVRHDEFAVLLPGRPEEVVTHLPAALAAISAAPLQVTGAGRFPVEAVAGVACVEAGLRGQEAGAMVPLVHADLALRAARATGGPGWSVYSGEVASAHARRLLLRERLALAVAEGGVDVHYQPIVNFTTGRVEKFEALARWDDVQLGRISPVEFIAVAEESNLVVALGEHVLRRAVASAHAAGVFASGARLAVNVSVVQLQSPGFADVVREILGHYRIPPHLLTLELTESVFLDSDSPAERVVTELAALGCQIAIDDFGTGYSAFGYLDRLPVHVLKVDRSLTQSMTGAGNGLSVVTAVVDLANRLGLTVVVEGVETDEEAAICRQISAGLGQGWLYSAAVTADRISAELGREYPVSAEPVR
ncbi:EAL domain-containing protein [Kineococcus sp. GCM10028916]|uniref:EAL domain-containing protein n=1 Tax=Kineococcus sp. GCM10028916 TaxID=3273394 RepID=UPI00362FA856